MFTAIGVGSSVLRPQSRCVPLRIVAILFAAAILGALRIESAAAGDLGVVPLFDGERSDSLDLWGGPFVAGSGVTFSKESSVVHSGTGAYQANLGTLASGGLKFVQAFSSGTAPINYRQDRDLTQYQTISGYVRNDTAVPLTFSLEIKDYRDDNNQRAIKSFTLPPGAGWTQIQAPLDLGSGWQVIGSPDLSRTYALALRASADSGPATGSLYFDDFSLTEKGPVIDVQTAPIQTIVEQLARRQFMGLWSARNKYSGLIPNRSDFTDDAALNTTTGVLWNLPSAVRHGWVSQADANNWVSQLTSTLNANRNQTTYLPTRFLDLATGAPKGGGEESTIDASFIDLALHNYKTLPTTSATLRSSIDALENRFNFAVFAGPGAFSSGYTPGSGISGGSYNGYTNENKVIALAAAVSTDHNVPLATMWNKDVGRTLASLTDPNQSFLTYSYSTEYRAAFAQALVNLFVDVSDRGVDNYPTRSLARNTWVNFVREEEQISDKLGQLGRSDFVQPDAGAGAGTYKTWNLFQPNNFGQPNLFQPWSIAEALLAGAPNAEQALRFLLDNGLSGGLDGPLGLADSAQWATGAAGPTDVPSFADNWNITLSTMALMAYLDGTDSQRRYFANLPEVQAALNTVFLDGDLNASGVTDAADLLILKGGFGASVNATPATGDTDGDGDVDGADFLRWQRGLGAAGLGGASAAVPEPASWAVGLSVLIPAAGGPRGRLRERRPRVN